MWICVDSEEIKQAKENVDPTLPLATIVGADAFKVTDEQLERGFGIEIPADSRFKDARISIFLTDTRNSVGFRRDVSGWDGMIEVQCPPENSSTFKGSQAQLWYYLIKNAGTEKWDASKRETYQMGTPLTR